MRKDPRFPKLHIVDHPLVQHKLTLMREKETSTRDFRELLKEIAMLMGYELTRDYPLTTRRIETPLAEFDAPVMEGQEARHRSGPSRRSRHDGRSLDAHARRRVGHIGLYRDENKRPVEYFVRLPDTEGRNFIVVDPMLATGYSGAYAVDTLKKRGIPGSQIQFMALVAAPEGVKTFTELHPDVEVYVAALDDHLDENAYIVPGLGDAGDRIFGTK